MIECQTARPPMEIVRDEFGRALFKIVCTAAGSLMITPAPAMLCSTNARRMAVPSPGAPPPMLSEGSTRITGPEACSANRGKIVASGGSTTLPA